MAADREMALFCFDVLHQRLVDGAHRVAPTFADGRCPLFVTWKKRAGAGEWELRGCIGNFTDLELHRGLREYALIAALEDTRFAPIGASELPHLSCGISLLVQFEDCARWDDWVVGTHGIRLSLADGARSYSATYLPEVAHEQGWDHRETLRSLLRKAGYSGTLDAALRASSLRVVRYQSSKSTVTYDEWRTHRRVAAAPPPQARASR